MPRKTPKTSKKPKKSSDARHALARIHRAFPKLPVTEVIDATKSIIIEVFDKDCKEGKSMIDTECALAKACKRQLSLDGVIIGLSSSYLIKGPRALRFRTSNSIAREMVSFDRSGDFSSGKYLLSPFSDASRMGARKNRPRGTDNGPKRRELIHKTDRVRRVN